MCVCVLTKMGLGHIPVSLLLVGIGSCIRPSANLTRISVPLHRIFIASNSCCGMLSSSNIFRSLLLFRLSYAFPYPMNRRMRQLILLNRKLEEVHLPYTVFESNRTADRCH